MTNGYKNKIRKLGEHTDVYFYEEQLEDHHWRLDLMSKQLVKGSRLGDVLAPSVDLSDRRLCLGRNISKSGRGKSITEQIIILPLTRVDRVLRKRSILKKGDISRNQVHAKTKTITPIPFLNSRVTKEDTLQ